VAATIAPDADLAALLPTTLFGRALTTQSFDGEELASSEGPDSLLVGGFGAVEDGKEGFELISQTLGVPLTEIHAAAAYLGDFEPGVYPLVTAIRLDGADPAVIVEELVPIIGGIPFLAGEVVLTEETVGGKPVSVLRGSSSATYMYFVGDVVFIVRTPAQDEAEELLGQLP